MRASTLIATSLGTAAAAVVGSVVGIALIVFGGRSSQTAIPFGPYLAAAGWIALLWGERIVTSYQALFIR